MKKKKAKPEDTVQKSNQKDNRTQTGEKRKRADGEKGAKEGASESAGATDAATAGHKRKRRRKTTASTAHDIDEQSAS